MSRYAIQYERFENQEWAVDTHMIDADTVTIEMGIARFANSVTGEEFMIPAENLVAAWSYGEHDPDE